MHKCDSHGVGVMESRQVDRISNLPDDVISNILSRLSTIQAMRTCALSQDWKHKWTSIYDIDIDASEHIPGHVNFADIDRDGVVASFLSFVDKVLDSRLGLSTRSVRLNIGIIGYLFSEDSNCILRWISKLVDLHVENLSIACSEYQYLVLHRNLECCTSLTELRLSLGCIWEIGVVNCFRKLKRLYISGGSEGRSNIRIVNKQSPKTGQLLLSFPVLENLKLGSNFIFLDVKLVEIDAPELISFEVWWAEYANDYVMNIRAPKLVRFVTCVGPVYDFVLCMPSLRHVDFFDSRESEFFASQVTTLLKGAPNLEFLRLLSEIMMAHAFLPTFNQLKQLELRVCANELWKFLHMTPYLESLTVHIEDDDFNHLPEPLPPCPQLKHVTFGDFKGGTSELALVRFFLEKAKKLERMVVYCCSVDKEDVEIRMTSLGPENLSRITVL